jgi:hypothetical protein
MRNNLIVPLSCCRLDHKPERQQHKQQLLECINFDRMNNYELAQVGGGL